MEGSRRKPANGVRQHVSYGLEWPVIVCLVLNSGAQKRPERRGKRGGKIRQIANCGIPKNLDLIVPDKSPAQRIPICNEAQGYNQRKMPPIAPLWFRNWSSARRGPGLTHAVESVTNVSIQEPRLCHKRSASGSRGLMRKASCK